MITSLVVVTIRTIFNTITNERASPCGVFSLGIGGSKTKHICIFYCSKNQVPK